MILYYRIGYGGEDRIMDKSLGASAKMGKTTRRLLLFAGLPVILYGLYILACVVLKKYGITELGAYELGVMLESEAMGLAISVGGVLLMDAEERNGEKK